MSRTTVQEIAQELRSVGDDDGAKVCEDAAAEIERLRAALREIKALHLYSTPGRDRSQRQYAIVQEALADE